MISLDIAKSRMVSLEFQKANTLKGAAGMAESNTSKKRISAETIQIKIIYFYTNSAFRLGRYQLL